MTSEDKDQMQTPNSHDAQSFADNLLRAAEMAAGARENGGIDITDMTREQRRLVLFGREKRG